MSNKAAYLVGKQVFPLEVKDADIPKPASGELVLKNESVGFNPVDWKIAIGGYIFDKEFPNVLGYDIGGTVEAVGEGVSGFKKGDRVLTFTPQIVTKDPKHGAFQKYSATLASATTHLPASVSFDAGATVGLAVATAAHGLFAKDFFDLPRPSGNPDLPEKTGTEILVWGGASSVGQYAVQLASQAGLTVYTTASAKHSDKLVGLGAAKVFDYSSPTVVEDIKRAAPGLKYVYDAISENGTTQQSSDVLQHGGKIAVTLPPPADIKLGQGVTTHNVFAGLVHASELELGKWLFNDYLETALESGRFVPNEVEKRAGGLDAVQAVLEEYKEKGISGKKFVINP